ncbi:carbohydrate ABC transporter permease, partial [Mesorhizobium sp. M4B.F.Ca.ET.143.01.1.1]
MTPKLKRTVIAWLLLAPLIVVTIFPFAVMFLTAVKPRTEVLTPTWWP